MNKQLSPVLVVLVVVVLVAAVAVWGYKLMQPAPYMPSPGVGGTPAVGSPEYGPPGQAGANSPSGRTRSGGFYQMPPTGAMPGRPPGAPRPAAGPNGQ